MPNTLTSIFVSSPATEPVEAPHPNTGVYVTGTQAVAGGPWTVVHTLITKTNTPLTMVGRLKNFPTVTVSVVATGGPNGNGNIFNNILATPTGAAATATSSTALSVAVSSIANQTAYRLLSATTAAGPFTQIYQGTGASYPHGGLTASQKVYYQWQYVGGGYYDDSPLSTVFSGATSAAGPQYQLAMITDSRGCYPGDTGTNTTSSVWALTQARITAGSTFTGTIVHHGYPGGTPADYLNTAYTNTNQYTTVKPAGQSAIQYLLSQLDATKTPVIIISGGCNGGTIADIKAIHDAIHAAVPGALTIVDPILNALSSNPSGVPSRAATNAGIHAGVGTWAQDEGQSYNTPQIYADDAPNDSLFFWNPDAITGLSKAHLTTVGNTMQSENYAQAYARQMGITLTPANPVTTQSSTSVYQNNAGLRYSGGSWTNYAPNAQYIGGFGAASASDSASFGFTANCYGWRIITPTCAAGGAIKAVEAGASIATGTQYSIDAVATPALPAIIMSKFYGSTLAVHTVDVLHNASATGTTLFNNLIQFCDATGVFPAISNGVNFTPALFTAVGGATLTGAVLQGVPGSNFGNQGGYDTTVLNVPASGYLEIDLGTVSLAGSTAAILAGVSIPANINLGTPRYAHQLHAWFFGTGASCQVWDNGAGGAQFSYTAGQRFSMRLFAAKTDYYIDTVLKSTTATANPAQVEIDVALKDGDSLVNSVRWRIVTP